LRTPEFTDEPASRAALLLVKETDKRIEIFDQVDAFYDARSNVAHGGRRPAGRRGPVVLPGQVARSDEQGNLNLTVVSAPHDAGSGGSGRLA